MQQITIKKVLGVYIMSNGEKIIQFRKQLWKLWYHCLGSADFYLQYKYLKHICDVEV